MRGGIRFALAAALAAGGLALASGTARAQEVQAYGSEEEYRAAVGDDLFCIDFSGSTGELVSGDSFGADVVFGSPEAEDPTLVNWSSDALSDAGSTTAPNGVGPVSGVLAEAAGAFHFTLSSAGVAPAVDLYDESDVLIATVVAPNAAGFFGVVSPTPVKSFVVRPGLFDETTGDLDRFFLDDFCVSGPAPEPEPEPGTPSELCADLVAAVEAADASAFRSEGMKGALLHKLDVICRRIDAGSGRGYRQAARKLLHDVLPKTDGAGAPTDWVVDPTLQQDLADRIGALLEALEGDGGGPAPSHGNAGGNGNGNGHGNASAGAAGRSPGKGRGGK